MKIMIYAITHEYESRERERETKKVAKLRQAVGAAKNSCHNMYLYNMYNQIEILLVNREQS